MCSRAQFSPGACVKHLCGLCSRVRAQRVGSLRREGSQKCLRDLIREIEMRHEIATKSNDAKTTTKNHAKNRKPRARGRTASTHTGPTHGAPRTPPQSPPLRTRREPGSHNAQAQRTRVGPLIARGETQARRDCEQPQARSTMHRAPCTVHRASRAELELAVAAAPHGGAAQAVDGRGPQPVVVEAQGRQRRGQRRVDPQRRDECAHGARVRGTLTLLRVEELHRREQRVVAQVEQRERLGG